jgi:hypothetical protein
MVAAEERKMAARKAVGQEEHNTPIHKQPKHKEAKDKMVHESKSAGKVDYKEAEETERKN